MRIRNRIRLIVLGLVVGLAAVSQAQEVSGPVKKPRPDTKIAAPPLDAKTLADPKMGAAAAALLESAYDGQQPPEGVRMLAAVLRGSQMGPGDGWFGPSQARYGWE